MVKWEYVFIPENSRQRAAETAFPFDLRRADIHSIHQETRHFITNPGILKLL